MIPENIATHNTMDISLRKALFAMRVMCRVFENCLNIFTSSTLFYLDAYTSIFQNAHKMGKEYENFVKKVRTLRCAPFSRLS